MLTSAGRLNEALAAWEASRLCVEPGTRTLRTFDIRRSREFGWGRRRRKQRRDEFPQERAQRIAVNTDCHPVSKLNAANAP